jgi:hypothetical protein
MLELLTTPIPVICLAHPESDKITPIYVVITTQGPMISSKGLWGASLNGPEFLSVAFSLGVKTPGSPRPEDNSYAAL